MRRICRALIASWALVQGGPAQAQTWLVELAAGRTTHELAVAEPESVGATLGLRHQGPTWLYVLGHLPTGEGVPWVAAGAGTRLAAGGRSLGYGVDLGGHGHGYRHGGTGVSGRGGVTELLPFAFVGGGSTRLELRSGIQHYTAAFNAETISRTLHSSDARAVFVSGAVRAIGEFRYLRAEEGGYPYAGAAIDVLVPRAAGWAYGGWWLSDRIDDPAAWGAGGRVSLRPALDLYGTYQREPIHPLYLNAPRTTWNVGLSLRLGRTLLPRAPLPVAPVFRDGEVTFRLPLALAADVPSIAGDFTGWALVPMTRVGDLWSVSLRIPAGVYTYAYRHADGTWFVPAGVPSRDDGMGGVSAVLIVP